MEDELKDRLEETVTCSICLDRYKYPLALSPCLHSYCKACLVNYAAKFSQTSPSNAAIVQMPCPECRAVITLPPTGIDGLTHNHALQNIVDNLASHEQFKRPKLEPRTQEKDETEDDFEGMETQVLYEGEGESEETVAAWATASSSSSSSIIMSTGEGTNNERETPQDNNNNNNNDSNNQQEINNSEEKVAGTSTNVADPAYDPIVVVLKPPRPPRPPPPRMMPQPQTALYPDITDEKARLQMELDAAERPLDFDPCRDGLLFKWGKYGGEVNDFRKPYGLAVSPQGDMFISDLGGSRILHFTEHGQFINKIVADCDIHDISLFPNGLVLVATSKARDAILRVYNTNGSNMGEYSGLHYKYARPSGVAIGVDNYAVVTSLENNCVYVFTEQGKLSKSFGWKGAGNEHFNSPAFLTTNQKNYIIVSDMGNHCLKVFTMEGTFKYCFGHKGKDIGMLMSPMGVCTDNDNNVIVADAGNFRVQAFSPKGRPLGCPLVDTFKIGANVRPINVAMDRRNNIVVLLLGTQFAEVRTYLWTPPPPDSLQDSIMKFTGSSMSKMFENIAGNF